MRFSFMLTMQSGRHSDIAEWRTRTVECAALISDHAQSTWPEKVAHQIWEFISPILPPETDKVSEKKCSDLEKHLVKVCEGAHQLALLVRGCKDVYQCQRIKRGEALNDEDAEPQDKEESAGTSVKDATVVFTIFGALVKYPNLTPGVKLVLEKAHVVIRD
jgi:hypothetical protein